MRKVIQSIKKYITDVLVAAICLSVIWVVLYRFIPIPGTFLMVKRKLTSSSERALEYNWTPWYAMTSFPKVCAMASEDQMLPFHLGLDLASIGDALEDSGKKRMRGASTISQQVAKNAFLFPSRNFLRKGFELYFTGLIEALWTKRRILEVYLNIAETGDKIFGVGSAAKVYFGKSVDKLTLAEAARIIAVLPNPIKYSVKKPGNYVLKRQKQIISLYHSLDGRYYLRELYVRTPESLYDFSKYKK